MTEQCNNCRTVFERADIVCPRCGTIAGMNSGSPGIECENHRGEPAIACCTICGKPVCGDCMTTRDGICFCDDPDHQKIHGEWELLMRVKHAFESDMISRNLQQAEIPVLVFDQRNHAEAFWLGERCSVRVFVRRGFLQSARTALESLGLQNIITE